MAKKEAAPQGNVISFDPDTFTSGGLFDDEDATIKVAEFVKYDFNGKSDEKTALHLVLEDNSGSEHEQYWSAGDPTVYWPSDDGKGLISTKTTLNSSSNYAIFLANLVAQGFPKEKLGNNIGSVVGLSAHWMRVPPPKKRSFGNRAAAPDGKVRDDLVLVVSQIHKLPWEQAGKGKGKVTGTTTAKPQTQTTIADPGAGGDDEEMCVAAVMMALMTEGGPIPKKQIAAKAMPNMPADMPISAKNKLIMEKIFKDDWLGAHPANWTYENGVVTAV